MLTRCGEGHANGVKRAVVIDVAEEGGRCSGSLRELEESAESIETSVCRASDGAVGRTLEDRCSARALKRTERAPKKASRSWSMVEGL